MSANTDPKLIDRLDNQLPESEAAKVDAAIAEDKAVAAEWAFLKLAVDTINLGAIRDKVAAVRAGAKTEAPVVPFEKKEGAVVRSLASRNFLRIAVIAVLILGASAIYKYTAVNGVSIYNKNFTEYELGTVRGNETGDKMEAAYRSRDWSGVMTAFESQPAKTSKSYFLAGMAQLELKKYGQAIGYFETVLNNDNRTGEHFYRPETEYYLALTYLMNNQTAKGLGLLNRIRSDVYHPYYPLAHRISSTDLKIVEMKK